MSTAISTEAAVHKMVEAVEMARTLATAGLLSHYMLGYFDGTLSTLANLANTAEARSARRCMQAVLNRLEVKVAA